MEKYNKKVAELLEKLNNENLTFSYKDFEDELEKLNSIYEQQTDFGKIEIKFVNKSTNKNPEYATSGSSGFDFRANLTEKILLPPGERCVVPTGLFFELPVNFEIQVRPRSGLAVKHGVTVLNSPGTVDSDFLGEIKIILINMGKEVFEINHGDRIAQGIIATVIGKNHINFLQLKEIEARTERNENGFGSTGIN